MDNLYDEIVITLLKDGNSQAQIRMEKGAIAALRENHDQTTGEILEMMFLTLVEEAKNKNTQQS